MEGDVICSEPTKDSVEKSTQELIPPKTMPELEEKRKEPSLPPYPTHGVIGNSDPDWLDIFHSSRKLQQYQREDFKKQKFDFYEFYEKQFENKKPINEATPIPGLHNLWREYQEKGLRPKTSDVYEIDPNLPIRFKKPSLLKGYGWEKDENSMFRTTSSSYGKLPPTIHDVPHEYHGLKNSFTLHLTRTGMPKNRSLNIK